MNKNENENPDWERMAALIAAEIEKKLKPEKRFLKSSEVRQMLGGISASKLQDLRIKGHIPAVNADGLWLYDYGDILKFTETNKNGGMEASRQ